MMIGVAKKNSRVPLPLLITGIAGVPGYNAFDYFRRRYPGQVIGIKQADNQKIRDPEVLPCNAEDRDALARLFERYEFRAVLDCAGNCALKQCEAAPEIAWRINVEGLKNLLAQTTPRGLRVVHLSSDLVFSGFRDGGYTEDDPTDPVTVYGQTMAVGEQTAREIDPAVCTLRISLPMGVSVSGHAGAIDWITSRFKKDRPATLYIDEIRTPTYTDCMNALYEELMGNDLAGIFHAGGPKRMSLYQIAQVINRVGGYNPDCLIGVPRMEAGPMPPRAGNVGMDSRKLSNALGYDPFDPWPYCETMTPTDWDWHRTRPAEEERSPARMLEVLAQNPRRRTAE